MAPFVCVYVHDVDDDTPGGRVSEGKLARHSFAVLPIGFDLLLLLMEVRTDSVAPRSEERYSQFVRLRASHSHQFIFYHCAVSEEFVPPHPDASPTTDKPYTTTAEPVPSSVGVTTDRELLSRNIPEFQMHRGKEARRMGVHGHRRV
ncbi:hypothetical protein Bbelb_259120 [Branchiostoma belcheri]|nr:hypothetical protein Bbelb_259120 [Branchiostoma belcheri]